MLHGFRLDFICCLRAQRALASFLRNPAPPVALFRTVTFFGLWAFNNSVQWYYDSTTKPVGSSLYEHGA